MKPEFPSTGPRSKSDLYEEKIPLSLYRTAADLKGEISKRIVEKGKLDWDFVNLTSRGSFLYLIFKPRV